MPHGEPFDPANTTPNTRLNKDPRFTRVNPNEASEHGEPIQDMVGESWPATIDVKWETPINGRFDIIGEGFKGGSTVKLFADGIAGRPEPLALGSAVAAPGRGSFTFPASAVFAFDVPPEKRTPVTVRADNGEESASASVPNALFYA